MKTKILSTVFTVGCALTGCGVDSIFEGGFLFWLFCFGVTAVCGYFLFGQKGD